MPIVTRGFGSNLIGGGFGSESYYIGISSTPELPSSRLLLPSKPLIIQVKDSSFKKIEHQTWIDSLQDSCDELQDLESKLSYLEHLVHLLEETDPLIVQINALLDAKITSSAFDDLRASADVSLDSLESRVSTLGVTLYTLETSLRIYLRKNQGN